VHTDVQPALVLVEVAVGCSCRLGVIVTVTGPDATEASVTLTEGKVMAGAFAPQVIGVAVYPLPDQEQTYGVGAPATGTDTEGPAAATPLSLVAEAEKLVTAKR
jgi:hypothetical protein